MDGEGRDFHCPCDRVKNEESALHGAINPTSRNEGGASWSDTDPRAQRSQKQTRESVCRLTFIEVPTVCVRSSVSTAGLRDLDQMVTFFPGMGPGHAMYGNLEIHSHSS